MFLDKPARRLRLLFRRADVEEIKKEIEKIDNYMKQLKKIKKQKTKKLNWLKGLIEKEGDTP